MTRVILPCSRCGTPVAGDGITVALCAECRDHLLAKLLGDTRALLTDGGRS